MCSQTLKIPVAARGRSGTCPRCKTKLKIPTASHRSAPNTSTPDAKPPRANRTSHPDDRSATGMRSSEHPAKPTRRPSTRAAEGKTSEDDLFGALGLPPIDSQPASFRGPAPSFHQAAPAVNDPIADDRSTTVSNVPPAAQAAERSPSPNAASPGSSANVAPPAASPMLVDPLTGRRIGPRHPGRRDPRPSGDQLLAMMRQQLSEPLPRRRPSAGYRLGVSLVAAWMLMMPLAYVALAAALAFGLYRYTFDIFPDLVMGPRVPRGRVMIFVMAAYLTPIVAGLITLIFMIKPIFFSLVDFREPRTRALTRNGEPLLFETVDLVCEALRAPKPNRIEVDDDVNASASYGRGLRALLGRELTLRIGVPLVSGLTVRQFTGVLAHEFGHFSQGGGMRAQIVVHAVSTWFAKVVYLRDGLDELLDESIEESESLLVLVFVLARFCVTIVRGILYLFMIAAFAISGAFSRQMEFDADRYQIAAVGSQTLATTMGEIHMLAFARGKALEAIVSLLRKAILIDDLPRMIQVRRGQMDAAEKRTVWERLIQPETGIFDSHPSAKSRIAAAEKADDAGVFSIDRPARELFACYEPLCRNVTLDFYRNQLGRMIDPGELQLVDAHMHESLARSSRR